MRAREGGTTSLLCCAPQSFPVVRARIISLLFSFGKLRGIALSDRKDKSALVYFPPAL